VTEGQKVGLDRPWDPRSLLARGVSSLVVKRVKCKPFHLVPTVKNNWSHFPPTLSGINTFRPNGVYILRGLSSRQSGAL
jgi:hypothetical protein